jgi:lipoprotein-anchoring transpeptidase ErfK/SrfK
MPIPPLLPRLDSSDISRVGSTTSRASAAGQDVRDEIRRAGAPGAAPRRAGTNTRPALTVPEGLSTFAGVSTARKLLEASGTIIVDTAHTYLYYLLGGGKALRYGIGVGRDGFT